MRFNAGKLKHAPPQPSRRIGGACFSLPVEYPNGTMPASRDFQIFAKPCGATCNLECAYCYYLDKELLYPAGEVPARMPDDLLEDYIVQHIAAMPGEVIAFSWHGGEPLALGLEYFERIVALQKKHRPAARRITNGIQTNGTLIDEHWSRFFERERFAIGLSLDGTAELHDCYRVATGGQPSHARAMRGYDLLLRHEVPCDVVCTVHNVNVGSPLSVYRFFRGIGAKFIGFLPVVQPVAPGLVGRHSISGEAYGAFLCAIFDEWIRRDVGKIAVQDFEEASRPPRGMEHSLCIYRPTCGEVPVIERNGDLYSCDHFVGPEHWIGNIRETPLAELLDSPAQQAFGNAKRDGLPAQCRRCDVLEYCHGGCPKNRILTTSDGEPGLNYLCAGYKRFFHHCLGPLERLQRKMEATEKPPTPSSAPAPAGRNDLCPCHSGLKYKKCCGK